MKKRDCRQFRQSDIHALRIRRNPQKSLSSFRFVSGVRCDGGSVANFGIVLAAVFHVVLLSQDGMMLLRSFVDIVPIARIIHDESGTPFALPFYVYDFARSTRDLIVTFSSR